jgi:hypothetical protein
MVITILSSGEQARNNLNKYLLIDKRLTGGHVVLRVVAPKCPTFRSLEARCVDDSTAQQVATLVQQERR